MKVVYTLASNIYQPSDIERALLCAETAAHQMGKAVRIVLESKAQMPVLNVLLTSVPVYTGEIADVANTLKKQGIVPDYEEVLKYCLYRGLSFDEACVVAKAFSQRSLLKMRGNPNFGLYWNNINESKWE